MSEKHFQTSVNLEEIVPHWYLIEITLRNNEHKSNKDIMDLITQMSSLMEEWKEFLMLQISKSPLLTNDE